MAKVIAACFLIGLVLTALFLVIFFSPPQFPCVTLVSLNVSRLNFTTARISGYVDMQFQVINGNMLTDFSYDDVYCSMYRGKRLLASTMFPAFSQRAWETKPINFTVYLTPLTRAREVGKDPYALEEFDVKLVTFIKWRFGSSKSVMFSCDEVPVGLVLTTPGHGKMIGPARNCEVC
ncbi:unnamed protein product [Eruca vesicaria subsp. sativa]|uniref:Late embryogenesis abundant protein LEA-2 subgroup domain-containing protein n=1 Tax=Eruca vesicaria subsp. sativa TaxID=29727 RepID=A0ABC8M1Q0_ERUVS|nr:unnamed protein product [Eruca vesicaria subsp. sativa]